METLNVKVEFENMGPKIKLFDINIIETIDSSLEISLSNFDLGFIHNNFFKLSNSSFIFNSGVFIN